jgi:methylmalonyl-CoA/ethylmalonyl-CoA epimerase
LSELAIVELEHVGVAVRSLDETIKTYVQIFGLTLRGVSVNPGEKVRVAFLDAGGVSVELLESTSPDGVVARFIERRGEGLHHLCFRVENLEGMLREMKARGVQLVDGGSKVSSTGGRMAFVHPKSAHGVLIELIEEEPGGR